MLGLAIAFCAQVRSALCYTLKRQILSGSSCAQTDDWHILLLDQFCASKAQSTLIPLSFFVFRLLICHNRCRENNVDCFSNEDTWKSQLYRGCGSAHSHLPATYSKVAVSDEMPTDLHLEQSMMQALTHPNNNAPGISLQEISSNLFKEQTNFIASTTFFVKQYSRESSRIVHTARKYQSMLNLAHKERDQLRDNFDAMQVKYKEDIQTLKRQLNEKEQQLKKMSDNMASPVYAVDLSREESYISGARHMDMGEEREHRTSGTAGRQHTTAFEAIKRKREEQEIETDKILNAHRQPILGLLAGRTARGDHPQPGQYRQGQSSHGYNHPPPSSSHSSKRNYESYRQPPPRSGRGSTSGFENFP